ncbi:homoserine O-succinyltransferase [Brevundimonas sp.]|uniref:homoserine O-succinyltransferase MetX n=1 Tax=Brevundimonas sp. TaxID=1871086 RepID=UPI001D579117|nr:homoserine O-succinyltransferase [Brevundimonas sp.]MBL0948536.1 homoserine O-succinyltransferase [Brevundimonas sp.]
MSLPGFCLGDGQPLTDATVNLRRFGPEGAPVIVVLGGISSDRRVADVGDGRAAWWPRIVRAGGPVDLDRYQVFGVELLPGPGEAEIRTLTPADQARALAAALDHLGIPQLQALIGASYGGMVGLAFAALYPQRLKQLIAISAPHRPATHATALRGIQRRILALGIETCRQGEAVALARELAMTTYRTPEELDWRFGHDVVPEAAGQPYAVCDYLKARGRAYVPKMSAERWISLSDSLDRHRVEPEAVVVPTTLLGFTSDQLVPIADLDGLAGALPNLRAFVRAPSFYGHDGFLKEEAVVADLVTSALSEPLSCCPSELAA